MDLVVLAMSHDISFDVNRPDRVSAHPNHISDSRLLSSFFCPPSSLFFIRLRTLSQTPRLGGLEQDVGPDRQTSLVLADHSFFFLLLLSFLT